MNARGIALVSGLVLLAAVSLLAVTAAGGMALQVQQAANFQDRMRAESAADAAQAAALAWLYSRPDTDRQLDCVTGCFLPAAIHAPGALPPQPEFRSATWWETHAIDSSRHPETLGPVDLPTPPGTHARWLIEEIHFETVEPENNARNIAAVGFYRLLARGSGRHATSVAVTEAIAARPWQGAYDPAGYPPTQALRNFCHQFDEDLPCGIVSWRALR